MVIAALRLSAKGPRREHLLRMLRAVSGPTRLEPGCIACQIFEEVDDASGLLYVELWGTREQLTARLRSSHYRKVLATMEESETSPELRFFWVSDVSGLEYLESVRLDPATPPPPRFENSKG